MDDIKLVGTSEKGAEMFKLKIDTSGTAFADPFFDGDDFFRQREIAKILRDVAKELEECASFGKTLNYLLLKDSDGEKCGEAKYIK